METIRARLAVFFLLTAAVASSAYAQRTRFTFVNNTQFTVYSVYIWPSDEDVEGADRLGRHTIESGDTRSFAPRNGECTYNIRVQLLNQEEQEWDDINLCRMETFVLQYDYQTRTLLAGAN